jgi:hypothetical protein
MTDKIKAEDFIKAFGSDGVKEPEHHIITDNIMEGYESPITLALQEIANKITEERDDRIVAEISEQMGVNVDKHELARALAYDRDQYRKGFEAAWLAREKDVMTWIPIKTRDLTEKEKHDLYDAYDINIDELTPMKSWAYDCPLPNDGDEVLVTEKIWGQVRITTFHNDEGAWFEDYDGRDDLLAWMSLPKPYEKPEQLGGDEND